MWRSQLRNNHIDAAVPGAFMALVLIIVAASARVWWQLLAGRRTPGLREEQYVPLVGSPVAK